MQQKKQVLQSWEIISRLARCLMVGLPCGQFQGCSISPMWITSFFISLVFRAVPTITCVNRHTLTNWQQHLNHTLCSTLQVLWTIELLAPGLKIFFTGRNTNCTHRFATCPGCKHLPYTRRSTHDSRTVAKHEDEFFNVTWAKGPILACR